MGNPPPAGEREFKRGKMARILIVDDEQRMRHLLSIMLSRRGYHVDQAGDGVEALEMIRATPFDMIITDIKIDRKSVV